MSKKKPVWTEPWLSWTPWLSWSAEYCLLSVYKKCLRFSNWNEYMGNVGLMLLLLIQKVITITVFFSKLQWRHLLFKEYIWFWHYLLWLLYSHLNTSCKSSTNNTEVSVESHLLFPDTCMSKLIWLDREDEKNASSLYVMKNCKFFFWIWVLQFFWQQYTHPLSCRVSCRLQWQHRCWNWTARWQWGNVAAEQWYSFTTGFKHGKAPDSTKQEPSRLPVPGLDFHRAALQTASVSEFRLHHWARIQILVQHLPLLRCHSVAFSAMSSSSLY